MSDLEFKPFVPAESNLREFTFRAVLLGLLMAIVLGAANAYLGLKAGMTVSATFPAAVVAMAVLRVFRGSILEENLSRTTASVGEALAAGAIFTLPAFVISGVWENLNYWDCTLIMAVGGVLGVLFVILLRRPLVEEAGLPFPESKACAELVKAGQHGAGGAKYVFGAMGLAAFFEFFKNPNGVRVITEHVTGFFPFKSSRMDLFDGGAASASTTYGGGMLVQSPGASPALVGVGYIIGLKLSSWAFAGGVLGWLVFIPLAMFFNTNLESYHTAGQSWQSIATSVWLTQVRPFAVGAMLVAAFYTLAKMRKPLVDGIGKAFRDFRLSQSGEYRPNRLEQDLNFKWVSISVVLLVIPITLLYWYFSGSLFSAIVAAVVMTVAGFLFSAVAGYLVGLIGGSNNPISGLTLSTLLVAALLMVWLGTTGVHGIAAVLGVAGVVCCTAGVAGDMLQDLKVGHILGGTPWRMELAEILGVLVAALVLTGPLWLLHNYTPGGIGGANLPAPQAGLMALMAKGIVGGEMAWPLVIMGGFFALGLILLGGGSPMLVAVGMYLPLYTTFAMFVGGLIKQTVEWRNRRRSEAGKTAAENNGLLLASGFVAGESLTAVLLAVFVFLKVNFTKSPVFSWTTDAISRPNAGWYDSLVSNFAWAMPWLGLIIFASIAWLLITIPQRKAAEADSATAN
ncbi:MAG: oligopeptide transporter, OPT family [Candidatus Glassbacteria bacterium]|nr:oligopeptide transporter, OPT family [Candidatus Glassbacteria bacterium]